MGDTYSDKGIIQSRHQQRRSSTNYGQDQPINEPITSVEPDKENAYNFYTKNSFYTSNFNSTMR